MKKDESSDSSAEPDNVKDEEDYTVKIEFAKKEVKPTVIFDEEKEAIGLR